jgi:hypothetical protein
MDIYYGDTMYVVSWYKVAVLVLLCLAVVCGMILLIWWIIAKVGHSSD